MSDLISRQAVLDELEKWDWQDLYLPIHFKQILDDVPSVENKGEWIFYDEEFYPQCRFASVVHHRIRECSICHHKIVDYVKNMNFCPNCGADMRGKAE